jgi:hypothetical protein
MVPTVSSLFIPCLGLAMAQDGEDACAFQPSPMSSR